MSSGKYYFEVKRIAERGLVGITNVETSDLNDIVHIIMVIHLTQMTMVIIVMMEKFITMEIHQVQVQREMVI